MNGLADRVLAVAAMLVSIRPLLAGSTTSSGRLSWRRGLVLGAGGTAAAVALVGLLALEAALLGRTFYLPSLLGGALAFFGGMLGVATLLVGRPPAGLTEDAALRNATLALAMTVYVAAPAAALAFLGLTRLARGVLPWTVTRARWVELLEGAVLLLLCLVPRDPTLGGLRFASDLGLGG
jgi:hypothetical protein